MGISSYAPRSGRILREDNSVINEAAYLAPIPTDFEKLTISAAATPLTPAKYADAITATICVEDAGLRYRLDGTAPTTAVGTPLSSGDVVVLQSPEEIAGFQGIATTATDAVLQVAYSK